MEVTQSNFKDVLPDIEEGIKNCTFLSIDCELTGLKTVSNYVNAFDTPKQYYQKVIKDCREFLVIQYGITLFRFDESTDSFKHKSYNFYIFRKPMNKYIQDQRFLSQTTSIDFLINQGFDFNKLFKNGISYLNNCEEEKCRTFLEEQHRKRKESFSANTNRDIIPIPEENQEFVNEIKNQLERFLITDETEISLPKCNAFVRRLIYQTNSQFFADKISLETRQVERERILFAVKINSANPEDKNKVEQTKYDESVKKLEDFIGFSKVMRLIVESGKLIVGHNVLLDFLHTIDKFLTPLPDDYDEFKECASSLFSKVSDTKYMASSSPFKEFVSSTVLGDLMDRLGKTPFEIPQYELEDGAQGYSLKDSKQHEAGYDSFITGLSFLAMWKFLGSKKKLLNKEIFGSDGFNLLNSYLNRICLMILTDQQYLNLAGPDLNPSRDHVFYLSFPREWNTNNLAQLFSPFGNVYISWISETSAYVGLFKRDQAATAFKTLSQSETYHILPFNKRQAQLTGEKSEMLNQLKRTHRTDNSLQTKRRKIDDNVSGNFSKSTKTVEVPRKTDDKEEIDETKSNKANKTKAFSECESWD